MFTDKDLKTIAFATWELEPEFCTHPFSADDKLAAELMTRGICVDPVPWDKADVDWNKYDAVIVRSTYDYTRKVDSFKKWCTYLDEIGVPVYNNSKTIHWNSHKHYLHSLKIKGVNIIPTVFINKGCNVVLKDVILTNNWSSVVIKPCVGADSYETHVLTCTKEVGKFQQKLESLVSQGDMMIQKYIPEVRSYGEWSLVFIDKNFSHAVLKQQEKNGLKMYNTDENRARSLLPPENVLQTARKIIAAIEEDLLYARIDLIEHKGEVLLMEVELIECYLFLQHHAQAIGKMADAIMKRVF